jgi:hypothetical protein
MTLFSLGRASALAVVGLLLAGCGGSSQSQATIPAAPSSVREASHHAKSWMKPGSSSDDLMYAVGGCGGTCVLSYPDGQPVGALTSGGNFSGICSDTAGNVFITQDDAVVEYAHGATTPTRTITLPGGMALGCSVDPMTNDLAVVDRDQNPDSDIAVFPAETGKPLTYTSGLDSSYCGYDDKGNLFVNGDIEEQGYGVSELPSGQSAFNSAMLLPVKVGVPGQLQWDGAHVTWEGTSRGEIKISRLTLTGSKVTVAGITHFKIGRGATQSWIDGKQVFIPYASRGRNGRPNKIGVWSYPSGGKPVLSYHKFGIYGTDDPGFWGVTFSKAP